MEAVAYVNWGRWVADCPDPHCRNAENVDTYPSTLRCSFCDRSWPLRWPDQLESINRTLAIRPVPATRNWLPGETVEQLIAENIEHLGMEGVY